MRGQLQQVRRLVPARLLPRLVRWRLDRLWADPDFRREQEVHMEFLLEHTDRGAEVPELAYRYTEQMMLRAHTRWHPRLINRQRIQGIEWLTTSRDPTRGVVLSFMHHGQYDGMFASLERVGVHCHALAAPGIMGWQAGSVLSQHRRVVASGATLVPAGSGTDVIAAMLGPGVTLAIACDVPGRTPVTFLGHKVLGSFGTARIATLTNSPVVLATARRDAEGPYIHIDAPIEPSDYDDPGDLLAEILRRHEGPILAWPEAAEGPAARWGVPEA
jgi:lauroyl/myristoyl acyltransferase